LGFYRGGVSGKQQAGKRPYRMQARAKAAQGTREKILEATEAVSSELPLDDVTLTVVAKRAGVTVQTVLRHFGNRDGLLMATLVHVGAKMGRDRDAAQARDEIEAIGILIDHYDKYGDHILRLLAAEERNPAFLTITDMGRIYHREWCERVFAAALLELRGAQRERRVAQFVAITDIYVWKLLRRDRGLSARQTKLALRELLEPLMEPRS
jgi:AcrR family transcriptional regulator